MPKSAGGYGPVDRSTSVILVKTNTTSCNIHRIGEHSIKVER